MINANFERLKAKLRRNKARGKEARADLINRLAAMDADKLRKVNPILIRKLGAQGIAEIASRNRAAATREAANVPKTGMSSVERTLPEIIREVAKTLLAFLTRKRLFQTLAKTVAVGTALGLVISFAATLAIVFLANWLNPVTPTSPCPRLDGLAIDCVYTTESNELLASDAARYLGEPLWRLALDNPGIPLAQPLPAGTRIRVPRKFIDWGNF